MAAIADADLSMLEAHQGDAVRSAKYRTTARRQMGNLVRLVDDLLDVSRITRGTMELRKEDVELGRVVRNALAVARPVIEARGHHLSVTLAAEELRLQADPTRLEQVVVNVLTNAAKYTEPGGQLSLGLTRDQTHDHPEAVLTVSDPAAEFPRRCWTRSSNVVRPGSANVGQSTGGLGLGLTLVKRLVEMHGAGVRPEARAPARAVNSRSACRSRRR